MRHKCLRLQTSMHKVLCLISLTIACVGDIDAIISSHADKFDEGSWYAGSDHTSCGQNCFSPYYNQSADLTPPPPRGAEQCRRVALFL